MESVRGRFVIGSLVAASIALAAAPAVADDGMDARATMALAVAAIRIDEPEVVVALMDGAVHFDLFAVRCGKGYRKPGKAIGKARLALARCLVALGRGAARPTPPAVDGVAGVFPSRSLMNASASVMTSSVIRMWPRSL